jgi:sugar lactone lactonase YvrE
MKLSVYRRIFFDHQGPGNLEWSKEGITIIGNGYGTGPDQLSFPGGLFMESTTQILYVTDISNNRIQKRYPDGRVVTAAGQSNGAAGFDSDHLWSPVDVFADGEENILITDWNNQRVQYWEKNVKNGRTIAGNGTRGSALNQFSYPSRVLLDSNKNIIVADAQNERITSWPFSYDPQTSVGTIVAVSSCSKVFL